MCAASTLHRLDGADLARALIERLRAVGVATDEVPTEEDFGCWFRFAGEEHPHCFGVGYRPPEPTSEDGVWIGFVERDRGFFARRVGTSVWSSRR